MINNFPVIDKFLQFEEGTFYKFELLVRNTDGENELFPERCSNTNKNILIKSWYVDTAEYYEKLKHEMITLSNLTGARIYVTLDRKDNVKLTQSLIKSYTDTLVAIVNNQKPGIKKLSKVFASETSKIENSSKITKTIMFDIDTTDSLIIGVVESYFASKGQQCYNLKTKKGYHCFGYKKFDHSDWQKWCITNLDEDCSEFYEMDKNEISSIKQKFIETVSVKANELGLVYHPMKEL